MRCLPTAPALPVGPWDFGTVPPQLATTIHHEADRAEGAPPACFGRAMNDEMTSLFTLEDGPNPRCLLRNDGRLADHLQARVEPALMNPARTRSGRFAACWIALPELDIGFANGRRDATLSGASALPALTTFRGGGLAPAPTAERRRSRCSCRCQQDKDRHARD